MTGLNYSSTLFCLQKGYGEPSTVLKTYAICVFKFVTEFCLFGHINIKVCMYYPDPMISFERIHALNKRATPNAMMNYTSLE